MTLLASIAGSIRLIGISIAIFFGTEIKFDTDLSGGDQLTEPTRGKGKGKGKWERQWGKAAKARERLLKDIEMLSMKGGD